MRFRVDDGSLTRIGLGPSCLTRSSRRPSQASWPWCRRLRPRAGRAPRWRSPRACRADPWERAATPRDALLLVEVMCRLLVGARNKDPQHWRVDRAGTDRVDADVFVCEPLAERLHETDHAVRHGRIDRAVGRAAQTRSLCRVEQRGCGHDSAFVFHSHRFTILRTTISSPWRAPPSRRPAVPPRPRRRHHRSCRLCGRQGVRRSPHHHRRSITPFTRRMSKPNRRSNSKGSTRRQPSSRRSVTRICCSSFTPSGPPRSPM